MTYLELVTFSEKLSLIIVLPQLVNVLSRASLTHTNALLCNTLPVTIITSRDVTQSETNQLTMYNLSRNRTKSFAIQLYFIVMGN